MCANCPEGHACDSHDLTPRACTQGYIATANSGSCTLCASGQ